MKLILWMTLLSGIALLSGCGTHRMVGIDYCEHTRAIWWDKSADLKSTPIAIVRQILTHNDKVEALCGFKLPKRY